MKKDTRIIMGICLLFIVLAGFLFMKQQNGSSGVSAEFALDQGGDGPSGLLPEETVRQEAGDGIGPEAGECAVYVIGAVKKPGIFRYKGSARVCDAIDAVGGFSKNAAQGSINLARVLEDGEQICVPTKAQAKKNAVQAEVSGKAAGSSGQEGLVNINKASLDELMSLPGIGQAKASLILDYRSEHGAFAQKEDLMKISGIKEGVYNKIKDLITI